MVSSCRLACYRHRNGHPEAQRFQFNQLNATAVVGRYGCGEIKFIVTPRLYAADRSPADNQFTAAAARRKGAQTVHQGLPV